MIIYYIFRPHAVDCRIRNLTPNIAYESPHIPVNRTGRGKKNINFRKKEKEILDEVLGSSKYDSRIRPAGKHNDTSELYSIFESELGFYSNFSIYHRTTTTRRNHLWWWQSSI